MLRYLLDTNTCIAIIKERPKEVATKLARVTVGEVGISSIVLAELCFGVERSQKRKQNQEALSDFIEYVAVLDWPARAAAEYGKIRTHLTKTGNLIGAMDLLIAAHAVTENVVLVTDNLREFRRVPKLKVENWIRR